MQINGHELSQNTLFELISAATSYFLKKLLTILNKFHKYEDDHLGRTKLFKRVSQQYHGITEQMCSLFVKTCDLCVLNKSRKSVKQPVYKPISSNSFGSRGQVDLIDMSSMNLAANLSPDGKILIF